MEYEFIKALREHKMRVILNYIVYLLQNDEDVVRAGIFLPEEVKHKANEELAREVYGVLLELKRTDNERFDILYNRCYNRLTSMPIKAEVFGL